jgi:hypothetical protein
MALIEGHSPSDSPLFLYMTRSRKNFISQALAAKNRPPAPSSLPSPSPLRPNNQDQYKKKRNALLTFGYVGRYTKSVMSVRRFCQSATAPATATWSEPIPISSLSTYIYSLKRGSKSVIHRSCAPEASSGTASPSAGFGLAAGPVALRKGTKARASDSAIWTPLAWSRSANEMGDTRAFTLITTNNQVIKINFLKNLSKPFKTFHRSEDETGSPSKTYVTLYGSTGYDFIFCILSQIVSFCLIFSVRMCIFSQETRLRRVARAKRIAGGCLTGAIGSGTCNQEREIISLKPQKGEMEHG